jgi:hypothetical protein
LLRFDDICDSGSWLALPSWKRTSGCFCALPALARPTIRRVAAEVVLPGCFQSSVSMLHMTTAVPRARAASYMPEVW